jgi:hypothetical protein
MHAMTAYGEMEVWLHTFLNCVLDLTGQLHSLADLPLAKTLPFGRRRSGQCKLCKILGKEKNLLFFWW